MNYYLYKLRFTAAVHFGESDSSRSLESSRMCFRADTLFSALCSELNMSGGSRDIQRLYELSKGGRLFFSDALPYAGDEFYLPRPTLSPASFGEHSGSDRKAMKKLEYIALSQWNDYIDYIKGCGAFTVKVPPVSFGRAHIAEKVGLGVSEKSEPYSVGLFSFFQDCGLYGLIGYEDEKELSWCIDILKRLGLGGIGGKRSSGYGAFEVSDEIFLNEPYDKATTLLSAMLDNASAGNQLLLTTAFPHDYELDWAIDGAAYKLARRGGFAEEGSAQTPKKKATQYFFAAGSVFPKRFSGDIFIVSDNPAHPVYRYSKPIFLGVDL